MVKEIFLEYAKKGAMTKEDLAEVLKISPDAVRRMAKSGKIPRIPGLRFHRFDPLKMIDVFCAAKALEPGSLTIKRHKTCAKGEFRKCL